MVLPGYHKEVKDITQVFKDYGIEKIEHRVIRPQSAYFVEENKIQNADGSYSWKLKRAKSNVDAATKVSPNQDNYQDFTTVLAREERWYNEEDRKVLDELYATINTERKWLKGFTETEDGTIISEDYHYNSLNYEHKTNFKGWTCYAGVTLLKVAPNGDIFIANCFQGGALANIYTLDESTMLPTNPVICQKERCTDPMDLRQIKYKEEKYKILVYDLQNNNITGHN
jgi:hypothetical protein